MPSLKHEVDPLSDLVTASELRAWRGNLTTKKILRYLERWRAQVLAKLAEGESLSAAADASAMLTTEYVAKLQLLKDILELEPKSIADFYGLETPKDDA